MDIQGETDQKRRATQSEWLTLKEEANPAFLPRFLGALKSGCGVDNGPRRHGHSLASVCYHFIPIKFSGSRPAPNALLESEPDK